MSTEVHSHKDLIVWQKAMDLVLLVYRLTAQFPHAEVYGLSAQMRRCSVSIPSNIAEGRKRGTRNDFRQFLFIAYGSGAELETQLEIIKRLKYGDDDQILAVEQLLNEVMRMLNTIIAKIVPSPKKLKS